jgi:YihY family inner membrane protein
MGFIGWLDDQQRRHSWLGLPLAVVYKMVDDQATFLAAMITYYGFLSLFPLLLLLVTILGFALSGNPALQEQVLDSALRDFPIIGDQIGQNIQSLQGSTLGLVVGTVGSVYGALGVGVAAQNATNKIWAVPRAARPALHRLYGRSAALLGVMALNIAATTALAALSTAAGTWGSDRVDAVLRVAAVVVSLLLNAAFVIFAYRVLTARALPARELWPGALTASLLWQVLQSVGTYLLDQQLRGATATYGLFGIVLGLLSWIYLAALILVLGAEINVVRAQRLYPRSLLAPDPTDTALTHADRRAYAAYAQTERQKDHQTVETDFEPPDAPHDGSHEEMADEAPRAGTSRAARDADG